MDIAENDRHDIEKRLQDMAVKEQYIARALEQLLGRSNQLEAREADLMHREEDYQRREGDFEDKMKSLNERARILSRQEDEFWKRDEDWRQLQASGNMITYPAEGKSMTLNCLLNLRARSIQLHCSYRRLDGRVWFSGGTGHRVYCTAIQFF